MPPTPSNYFQTNESSLLAITDDKIRSFMIALRSRELHWMFVGPDGTEYPGLALASSAAGFQTELCNELGHCKSLLGERPSITKSESVASRIDSHANSNAACRISAIIVTFSATVTPTRSVNTCDLSNALTRIAPHFLSNQLVLLTGAVPPGTTRELDLHLSKQGFGSANDRINIAYSPEPDASHPERVVAGIYPEAARLACALLSAVCEHVSVLPSLEAAELHGLVSSARREVLAAITLEIGALDERIGTMDSDPSRIRSPYPLSLNIGVPGCAAAMLAWAGRSRGLPMRLFETACEINADRPTIVAQKVSDVLNAAGRCIRASRVLVLGSTRSRASTGATSREHPCVALVRILRSRGAVVTHSDDGAGEAGYIGANECVVALATLTAEFVASQDCVVFACPCPHDHAWIRANSSLVVDAQGEP